MNKHIGSTIAVTFGLLAVLAGLANPQQAGSALIMGVVVLLGGFAYRSSKKRNLGEHSNTKTRIFCELLAIVVACFVVLAQNNFKQLAINDPLPNVIAPLWVVIAYIVISVKQPSNA